MRLKPKKRLGQNFLKDKNIQRKIIRSCALSGEDIVLEIGAGLGDLTNQLALAAKDVYALEIDRNLIPELEKNTTSLANCRVIKADILEFDINKFIRENKITQKIKVIANIPYYISSPIIERLIQYRAGISKIFLTVQKEFGRRVAASPGGKEYGSFSCFSQYYLKPKILFEIKKNSFFPAPKVDSCFLSLEVREKPAVQVEDEEKFFKLLRAAFNQRRKTLRNSLEGIVEPESLKEFLDSAGIDVNARPEMFSLSQFADLSNSVALIKKS
ncbi:MAG: 16S rRNA (adenine(1518)-N(6)/adenine(1519)-N(6))-dimethyltransferase RsmA [Candidatus Omnitrophica bacterium]|nr:16S rRNA (adenine(1518)-N(6)/adenine(1519)-N(6))-dimethyltransferase RsmA [Candidatus Omnitrophota bacterium]